jgi:hypothetical protein
MLRFHWSLSRPPCAYRCRLRRHADDGARLLAGHPAQQRGAGAAEQPHGRAAQLGVHRVGPQPRGAERVPQDHAGACSRSGASHIDSHHPGKRTSAATQCCARVRHPFSYPVNGRGKLVRDLEGLTPRGSLTVSCLLRIGRVGFGTGRQKMALERCTTPAVSRRTCSPGYGLQSC